MITFSSCPEFVGESADLHASSQKEWRAFKHLFIADPETLASKFLARVHSRLSAKEAFEMYGDALLSQPSRKLIAELDFLQSFVLNIVSGVPVPPLFALHGQIDQVVPVGANASLAEYYPGAKTRVVRDIGHDLVFSDSLAEELDLTKFISGLKA